MKNAAALTHYIFIAAYSLIGIFKLSNKVYHELILNLHTIYMVNLKLHGVFCCCMLGFTASILLIKRKFKELRLLSREKAHITVVLPCVRKGKML